MNPTLPLVPIITSVAALAASTDAWVCDVWGVLHNGAAAFPAASAACLRFRADGGTVVLVSNAPRQGEIVTQHLVGLGVAPGAFDAIITAGDVARDMLRDWQGRRVYHLGPERDLGLFDDLTFEFTGSDTADVIACSGLFDDTVETPEDYRGVLTGLARREIPMICANPDIKVERGHELVWCAGGLADLYEKLGGSVAYAGKPHPAIYESALARIAEIRERAVAKDRVLAIGDGLRTDVAGAHGAGLRCLFVASALHFDAPMDATALHALFAGEVIRPEVAAAALVW